MITALLKKIGIIIHRRTIADLTRDDFRRFLIASRLQS